MPSMKLSFLSLLAGFFLTSDTFAEPNPLPGSNDTVVRDPAIWYNPDLETYFVFSTDEKIRIFTSSALTGPWTREGSVLPNCSVIDLDGRCTLWAPDPGFCDWCGDQLKHGNGTWSDLGAVVRSSGGSQFNAIDGNLINDNGLKLSFGSHSNGLYQIEIGPDVNDQASNPPGTHLAGHDGRPAEGVFVYRPQNSTYFFCFFSDGITLIRDGNYPPAGQEYKVLVGRGTSAAGPFYDKMGNALTDVHDPPTGSLVLGSHDDVYAPGGQSIFNDLVSGKDVMVYHYISKSAPTDRAVLGINYLDFSSGWPVVVD